MAKVGRSNQDRTISLKAAIRKLYKQVEVEYRHYNNSTQIEMLTMFHFQNRQNKNVMSTRCTSLSAVQTSLSTNYIPIRTILSFSIMNINTLRTGSFKLFKRQFPGFLTILTL